MTFVKKKSVALLLSVFLIPASTADYSLESSNYRLEIQRLGAEGAIVLGLDKSKNLQFLVSNNYSEKRTANITVSGLESTFPDGKTYREVNISSGESIVLPVQVNGTSVGEQNLNITSESELGVQTLHQFQVLVRRVSGVSETRSVPGITGLQVLALVFSSTLIFLFSSS